ncbi:MAG TPA: hypothetical protein PKO38_04390, partial [Bacillota bacterium]|nr:hypothetical protein [Bacillota bacterium]
APRQASVAMAGRESFGPDSQGRSLQPGKGRDNPALLRGWAGPRSRAAAGEKIICRRSPYSNRGLTRGLFSREETRAVYGGVR